MADSTTQVFIGSDKIQQVRNVTENGTTSNVVEQHQEGSFVVPVSTQEGFTFEIPYSPSAIVKMKSYVGTTARLHNVNSGEDVEYSGVSYLSHDNISSDGKSAKWMTVTFHCENRL